VGHQRIQFPSATQGVTRARGRPKGKSNTPTRGRAQQQGEQVLEAADGLQFQQHQMRPVRVRGAVGVRHRDGFAGRRAEVKSTPISGHRDKVMVGSGTDGGRP